MNFVLHKKCMFFIFCIITILLLSRALRIEVANSSNTRYHIYSVEFNYYGMDAKRIEKAITIPLEEKIMKMNNLAEFSSVIEHNQSVTSAYFYKKANTKTTYLELRSIVENIYTSLPHSVQKPRIYTSDSKSSNILCIAFTDENISKEMLETKFKNQLLSIDGVSEVNISGGTSMEVLVNFDPSELIYLQQEPANLSKKINEANETSFSSMMKFGKENLSIYAKTKINSLEELNLLPIKIGDSTRELKSFSNVSFSERKQDEITRINGKECSAINVKSSNGNIIAISKKCKTIIEKSGISKNSYTVLYDLGEKQYSLIKSVVIALAQSFICVLLVIPFFFSSKIFFKGIFFLLVSTCTWTLGLLQYFGYSLNQHTIAGISISLGLIIDSSLVIFSVYEQSRNKIAFIEKLQKTQLTLCSATITTALASIPLFFLETIVPGAKTIAISILFMLICSMILSQIFLPCYLYQDREEKQKFLIAKKAEVFYTRLSYILALQSIKRKKIIKVIYMGFVFFPILFIIISEKNLSR
ncbi:MAG: efflux RND transporter permease subunit, partial [Treponema sp.]|nr:efflux RND transporter permease subunit [Treponema sp.]